MKRLTATAIALLACLAFAPTASATWANKYCSIQPINHCYALARWYPNIHKAIKDVWWYVNPEDVRFSHTTSSQEFLDMETWVSWAEPGRIVEYPMEETYWVEAGESWTSHGCEFFTSAQGKWAEGYYNFVETPCTGHTKQLFKVQREPTKEICVYWNSNPSWCFEPGFLPQGNFTQLNSGLEIATDYKPTSVKGNVEAFALGGVNNWWQGSKKAGYLYTREHATCVWLHNPGPGSVSFASGAACPDSYEKAGPGLKWKEENEEEEPRASAFASFSEATGENEVPPQGPEEPWSLPERGSPSPTSQVDTFAGYSEAGFKAKVHDKERAVQEVQEANPGKEVEVTTADTTYEHTGAAKHGKFMATSPGQEALQHSSTYVVEVETKPEMEVQRDPVTGALKVAENNPELTVPHSGTLAGAEPPEGENVRFVYDSKTGHLDQIAWGGQPLPRQSQRIAHRREMFLDKFELERWHKNGGPAYCRKSPSKACEEAFAQEADYKAKLKAERAELKARLKREKKEAHEELKREAKLNKTARVSVMPSEHDPRFAHVSYDELSAELPVASVAVYHHGFRLYHRQGRHMRAHLRVGKRYAIVARGDNGLRCVRHIRIRYAGQHVRLRWRNCKR